MMTIGRIDGKKMRRTCTPEEARRIIEQAKARYAALPKWERDWYEQREELNQKRWMENNYGK